MIEIEEFVDRLCRIGAHKGPRRFPRKPRDREILIKSIRMSMDAALDYSEPEINGLLGAWMLQVAPEVETDVATLRRMLVDYGELERSRDCRSYRLGYPGRPVAFALEIDELDLPATIAAYRMDRDRRRAAGREAAGLERQDGDSR